jgi:hypothetical protein
MSFASISVKVNSSNQTKVGSVEYKNNFTVKTGNQNQYTVKTVNLNSTSNKLSGLSDVSAQNPQDGNTLVYDATRQLYVVKELTANNITLSAIDAGQF